MLNQLRDECHKNAVEHGFWEVIGGDGVVIKDGEEKNCFAKNMALVVSEIGEAIEADRKGWRHYPIVLTTTKPKVEEWRDVDWTNGKYQVSNWGRVRSRDMQKWNGKVFYEHKGQLLKPALTGSGYMGVAIGCKTKKICHLVAEAFLGKRENGQVIDHINTNKIDDYVGNLQYVSSSENNKRAYNAGLKKSDFAKTTFEEKIELALLIKSGVTDARILSSNKYNHITKGCLKYIRRNKDKYQQCCELELADIIIRVFDLAGHYNIDLDSVVRLKMDYNSQRPYKHGKSY